MGLFYLPVLAVREKYTVFYLTRVQYSTVQYSTVQYSTVQYSIVRLKKGQWKNVNNSILISVLKNLFL